MLVYKREIRRDIWIFIFIILGAIVFSGCAAKQIAQPVRTEVTVVDILPHTRYTTKAYIYDSTIPGPVIMVMGGVHGNEPAGAVAAEEIMKLVPVKGKLIIVPRVNKLALEANVRTLAEITDINRAYPGSPGGKPAEQIAFEIAQLMKKNSVTMLIDLHEARTFNSYDPTSLGQSIILGENDKGTMLALDVVDQINKRIVEAHKKFTLIGSPAKGSTAYYASNELKTPAFTVETSGEQPLEDRVAQHVAIVKILLVSEGLIENTN